MDPDQPAVQIIQKSFWQTKKSIVALTFPLALILFAMLMIALNYFDVISVSQLSFLPKRPATNLTGTPVKITLIPEDYGFKAGDLTLNCPVESVYCKSQKLINLNKQDAVFYRADSGSTVSASLKIPSLENMAVLTNQKSNKKYFYESTISKNGKSCYTIAYTLSSDITFQNILNLDFLNNKRTFATLGSQTFQISGGEANVLIQVRNTPMDLGIPCSLIKKSPEFFQNF